MAYYLGMDVGSTASKCVIIDENSKIVSSALIPSGTGTSGPGRAFEGALFNAGLKREDIACITATGYGRNTFDGADYVVSELSAHAKGIHSLYPDARTVIDIGGQDAKVLHIGSEGKLDNFIMNDKCAAGTGRFLEVMARVLELEVHELGKKDEEAREAVSISSTCTVFAESEVISKLSSGVDIPSLVKGIHESVAVRTASLVKRLGVTAPVYMSGGVAKNRGVVRALERELKQTITVSEIEQLNGAFGAAVYGLEKTK